MVQVLKTPRTLTEIEELADEYSAISGRLRNIAREAREEGVTNVSLKLGTLGGCILEKLKDSMDSVETQARIGMRRTKRRASR